MDIDKSKEVAQFPHERSGRFTRAEAEMRVGTTIAVLLAGNLAGCTTIEIHGSGQVEVVRQVGFAWTIEVQATEPVLVDRTSIGLEASAHELVLGFRQSRTVYRPVTTSCQVLIVVDRGADADDAVGILTRASLLKNPSMCVLRN